MFRNKFNKRGTRLDHKKYKTLSKEIKQDLNKWKNLLFSWIRRFTNVNWK